MIGWDTHYPTSRSWDGMLQRCNNPNSPAYKYYGGRGIKVCKRWHALHKFVEDMGLRPKGTTLERIKNSRGYTPKNCRWATKQEQMQNTKSNRRIIIDGQTRCLAEWCRIYSIDQQTVTNRRQRSGLPWKVVLTTPLQRGVKLRKEKK